MGARSYSREGRILKLLTLTTVIVLCQGQNVTVVLDVYTPTSTLDNNTTLQLGTTCILICRTGGLPHGTDYNYTWTCPNGPCTIGQGTNTNRDTYGDRLLLNILSYSDAGTYTCQVRLATTGQLLRMDRFVLGVEGGIVLHSGNNLIPNNDFITSVQHITSSTTITIQCTSHQQPHWRGPNGQTLSTIQNNTLHQILNGNTSILTIDTNNLNNFTNGRFSCNTTQHTANVNLYIGPGESLPTPGATSRSNATHTIISPTLDTLTQVNRFIVSYQRQDLNALDVEYQEAVVTGGSIDIVKEISIPGVMYDVTMWAVNGSQYSQPPVTIPAILLQLAQAPSKPRFLTVTTTFTQGLEFNWIPPKQTNGPILYQLNYGTNTTHFTTVDTASDDTYYNLTGLQQNTTYYIRVVAVSNMTANGVARTEGEWITVTTAIPTTSAQTPTVPDTNGVPTIGIAVGVSAGLLLVIIIILIAVVGRVLWTRQKHSKPQTQVIYSNPDRVYDTVDDDTHKTTITAPTTYNYTDKDYTTITAPTTYDYIDKDYTTITSPTTYDYTDKDYITITAPTTYDYTDKDYTTITPPTTYDYIDKDNIHGHPQHQPAQHELHTNITDTSLHQTMAPSPNTQHTTSQHYQSLQHNQEEDYTTVYTPLSNITSEDVLLEETVTPNNTQLQQTHTPNTTPAEGSQHYSTLNTNTMEDHHYQRIHAN